MRKIETHKFEAMPTIYLDAGLLPRALVLGKGLTQSDNLLLRFIAKFHRQRDNKSTRFPLIIFGTSKEIDNLCDIPFWRHKYFCGFFVVGDDLYRTKEDCCYANFTNNSLMICEEKNLSRFWRGYWIDGAQAPEQIIKEIKLYKNKLKKADESLFVKVVL